MPCIPWEIRSFHTACTCLPHSLCRSDSASRDTWSWQSIPRRLQIHPPAAYRDRVDSHHIRIRSSGTERLLVILFALSLSADFQHGNRRHLCKFTGAGSCSHGNKRIIATATCHGIKLIFPSLEALFEFFLHIRKCSLSATSAATPSRSYFASALL